ncbi:hypothetical protein MTR67_034591 [Solanum verrucosum]|uniref:Uncharacterized protein n=1 Tax=Solanum verrucosum TaxID=315347 RepID=A0AAF0ZIW0_SOLVR|nr:hypothetical protein MTR67_034591 [Solanum verrucosum]
MEAFVNKLSLKDDVGDLNNANEAQLGSVGVIRLPPIVGYVALHVTSTKLQLLQAKGVFGGLDHENPHDHIQNFVDVCSPFSLKNILQESVRLQLFPFSLMGGSNQVVSESTEELHCVLGRNYRCILHKILPPSKMVNLSNNIRNFKRVDGEPIHETWLRFQKLLLQCLTHGLSGNVILQYFYQSLDSVNKGVADHLSQEGIMLQPFQVASSLLDEMTKTNQAWVLARAIYNMGGNQVWNTLNEEERRVYNQDCTEQNHLWKREDNHEEYHMQSSDSPRSKCSSGNLRVEELLSRILEKIQGSDDMHREMKADFLSLNNKVNSHADAIKQLECQMSQLSTQLEHKLFEKRVDEYTRS